MSKAAKLDEQKNETIKAWRTSFLVLAVICIGVIGNNYGLRKIIPLWLPPDLSSGQIVNAGKVDKAYTYNFALNIFSGLTRWKKNGEVEYRNNIDMFTPYLSPSFVQQLNADYIKRTNKGRGRINELKGRTREVSLIKLVKPSSMVKKVTSDLYIVYLDVYDEERVSGKIVKSGAYRYPISVGLDTANLLTNDTGLRILGFAEKPFPIAN